MPEAVDQPAPPLRTWRPMVLWTVGILLALGLIWFVGAVVVAPRVLRPRNETFGICAVPAKYGAAGRRSFILITNGTTFGHDWGKQVEFFDDYPVDPISSPWMSEFNDDE